MFLFVAFGTGVVINTRVPANGTTTPAIDTGSRDIMIPFGFGLMITVLVFAIGDISGANLNPAVTLALAVTHKMSWLRAVFYLLAQCAGAIAGSAYIYGMVGKDFFSVNGGAANAVAFNPQSYWTPLGGELLGTYLLVFTVCAAADVGRDSHTKYVGAMTPLAIGFAVFLAHIVLVPIDGCSINPARSLGSAVVQQKWDDHWVVRHWAVWGVLHRLMTTLRARCNISTTRARSSGWGRSPARWPPRRRMSWCSSPPPVAAAAVAAAPIVATPAWVRTARPSQVRVTAPRHRPCVHPRSCLRCRASIPSRVGAWVRRVRG